MALFGHRHIPFASVSEKAANISITFQSPTKTFNIAGIITSHAIVPNKELRDRFCDWRKANELDEAYLCPIATIAAFRKGEGGVGRCWLMSRITSASWKMMSGAHSWHSSFTSTGFVPGMARLP